MKKFLLSIACIAAISRIGAQVNMPAPSPTQSIHQDFGMGKLELTYSRPSLKDRTYFGDKSATT